MNNDDQSPDGVFSSVNPPAKVGHQPDEITQPGVQFPSTPTGAMPVSQFLSEPPQTGQHRPVSGQFNAPGSGQFSAPGSGQFSAPGSGQFNAPGSGQFNTSGSEFPNTPSGQFPNTPSGQFPNTPSGQFPNTPSGQYQIKPEGDLAPIAPIQGAPSTGQHHQVSGQPVDTGEQKYVIRASADETGAQETVDWLKPDGTPTQRMRLIFGGIGFGVGGLVGLLLGIMNSALQGASFGEGLAETFMIAAWFGLFVGIAGGAFPDRVRNVLRQQGLMD